MLQVKLGLPASFFASLVAMLDAVSSPSVWKTARTQLTLAATVANRLLTRLLKIIMVVITEDITVVTTEIDVIHIIG